MYQRILAPMVLLIPGSVEGAASADAAAAAQTEKEPT